MAYMYRVYTAIIFHKFNVNKKNSKTDILLSNNNLTNGHKKKPPGKYRKAYHIFRKAILITTLLPKYYGS
ncbi:hypothetical protein SAMN05192574_104379 [Mucilaginibacter gossypiicola]|uniref:Uncharacterized protein n=1 Tax=Mucilaginibacter gossypiicola TaxID=551995 RepID=A0A1H8K0P4_9SPHI|nr:hypothetical protein SAMN05192574_104379 [Mucilaginibacter gossypiicola]